MEGQASRIELLSLQYRVNCVKSYYLSTQHTRTYILDPCDKLQTLEELDIIKQLIKQLIDVIGDVNQLKGRYEINFHFHFHFVRFKLGLHVLTGFKTIESGQTRQH